MKLAISFQSLERRAFLNCFPAGKFGAYMKVGVDIDGPVTLLLDSRRPEAANSEAAAGADDAE